MPWGAAELAAAVRTVISVVQAVKSWRPRKPTTTPNPRERAVLRGGHALLEIENLGATGEFRAQIIKVVNVEDWPEKPVWARWHHDKDAKSMKIPGRTRASIRVATWFERPNGNKWKCHWGSDFGMVQGSMARGTDAEIHIQIVAEPEREGGPYTQVVLLRRDGTIGRGPKITP
jgi:hypothetical protein